ncbi:MAG: hypothetical protein HUJ99_06225, partial [Bacteroidaceae bacterium]|nr:hypothetical protein [Bacteroidaceae bacterium]
MKHFLKTACALFVMMLAVSSCQKNMEDTLDEHSKTLAEYGNRIAALETLCSKMNTNIASLQSITAALEGNDYVKSVTPVTQGGKTIGYTITFTKSSPITIYHGTDGKNGTTPIVGISKFTDGNWYWTLNGAWLLDSSGKKIKANGTDGTNGAKGENGKDAIAPQLKIEGGKWKLSTDGGKTWTEAGTATGPQGAQGEPGDSFFKDVEETDTEVI